MQESIKAKIGILILDDQPMWQVTTEEICKEILQSLFEDKDKNKKVSSLANFFVASNVKRAREILLESEVHLLLLDKDLGVDKDKRKISPN